MKVERLHCSYAVWKEVAINNNFDVYEVVEGEGSRKIFCGTAEMVYVSDIDSDDYVDYQSGFSSSVVFSEDDALAKIIGTSTPIVFNRDKQGARVLSVRPYAFAKEKTTFKGYSYIAQPGALNIFDEPTSNDTIYIQGGKFWVKSPNLGDYAEMSVVDKDNVLGLFSQYGLTEGVDVLEISKWVRNLRIPPWDWECELMAKTVGELTPGLYLRIAYQNVGADPVDFGGFYLWYES